MGLVSSESLYRAGRSSAKMVPSHAYLVNAGCCQKPQLLPSNLGFIGLQKCSHNMVGDIPG